MLHIYLISGKSLKNSSNKILKEIKTMINKEKLLLQSYGIFDVDSITKNLN